MARGGAAVLWGPVSNAPGKSASPAPSPRKALSTTRYLEPQKQPPGSQNARRGAGWAFPFRRGRAVAFPTCVPMHAPHSGQDVECSGTPGGSLMPSGAYPSLTLTPGLICISAAWSCLFWSLLSLESDSLCCLTPRGVLRFLCHCTNPQLVTEQCSTAGPRQCGCPWAC